MSLEFYKNEQKNLPISKVIFMETNISQFLEETLFIESISDQKDTILSGIVCHIPMKEDIKKLIKL